MTFDMDRFAWLLTRTPLGWLTFASALICAFAVIGWVLVPTP